MSGSDKYQAVTNLSREQLERLVRHLGESGSRGQERITHHPDRSQDFPLSFTQQRLWFLDRLAPGSSAYNIPAAISLTGELDVAALERAFNEVVRRHESLRTSFSDSAGTPRQVIAPELPVALAVTDLSHLAPDERAAQAAALADSEARLPFDLSRPPLFRAALLRLSATEHHLLLTLHHVVADGWSIRVLVRELSALYESFRASVAAPLPALPIQYADYSVWQREWLAGAELERQLGYWRERLRSAPPLLEIPADRPRPAVQSFRGARLPVKLSASVATAVKDFARSGGATSFMVLLAAFEALLWRYTGQDDIVIGTPVANRNRAEVEGLIGYFANTLVLRTDLSGGPTFRQLVDRVRETSLGALAHQDLPFEKLVEELRPDRSMSHNPAFQVLFALQSATALSQSLPQLRMEFLNVNMGTTRFDLSLELREDDNFSGSFEYSTDLFDADTIERMAGYYRVLLEAAVNDPDRAISTLPLLTDHDQRELLSTVNGDGELGARDVCLHHSFEEHAISKPDAIAVSCGARHLTYRELDARANQLARHLRKKGVGPEVPVGIFTERSVEMVVAMLAVLKAGGAYVPLDPIYKKERLAFIVEELDCPVLLAQRSLFDALPRETTANVICIDDDWAEVTRESDDALCTATPSNTAYIIYTSGSTGRPKGVQVTHQSAAHLFEVSHSLFDEHDVWTVFHSYAFDFSVWEIWAPLTYGGRLVIVPADVAHSPADFHELLRTERVTVLNQTPSALRQLVEAREDITGDERSWYLRLLVCGGEALPSALIPKLLEWDIPVWNFYGPTEATVWSSVHLVQPDDALRRAVPIGRPLPGVRLYVLDAGLQPSPIGVPGELYVAGNGLARGYLQHPSLTAEHFIPDPFSRSGGERLYRTGDVVRLLPNGELEFIGRADEQLKVRGFRVEPGEIEATLCRHQAVSECVVVTRSTDNGSAEQLIAYVVPSRVDATAPWVSELRMHAQRCLPDYMVPSTFVVIDFLPLTRNGKVDRRALPAPNQGRPELMVDYAAPRTELEMTIASTWEQVLQIEKVGVNDNFFELGGHSLLLARAHQLLRRSTDEELTMVEMFQYPTVATLAEHIRQRREARSSAVEENNFKRATLTRAYSDPPIATGRDVAVIGMACRFPGAKNVEEFWRNLRDGVESISFFSDEDLRAEGFSENALRRPDLVKAASLLEGIELFDADFFGFSNREAELLDPQHRIFLESAWEALESAGYDPEKYDGRTGVFVGSGLNTYGLRNLLLNPGVIDAVGGLQALIASDKDYLSTRASYKLNLRGPSINVNTACSTSLVATHLACQSLLTGESDMALAGGVSIKVPQKTGYFYQKDGVLSPDGHCRAFDARAQGTAFGSGVGVVVLKRLHDALRDGDHIHAVIKGSAVNNDGALKVGYTAPSVDGQAEVIAQALAAARVEPATINYVEMHGTATPLGDPVEIAGLKKAFGASAGGGGRCAIGSVKTNFGHLDTAAGVGGMIKTILSLGHQVIPPSLHFEKPNPNIDFSGGYFYVNARLQEWKTANGSPRRAGVSSFGVGGTNAHVILEEAPEVASAGPHPPWRLLLLSAKTETALESATDNLARHLAEHPRLEISDVAYTLHVGRRHFSHRRALVCSDRGEVVEDLRARHPGRVLSSVASGFRDSVAFMFPGVADQYVNMGLELYRTEPVFREHVDHCCEVLRAHLDRDLRETLYPQGANTEKDGASGPDLRKMLRRNATCPDEAEQRLSQTSLVQPALFTVEYALARLCMSWGIMPRALIGYSLGEYTAACLAGIFSLEDALRLVALRARMIEAQPAGAMLAVALPESEVRHEFREELALAAVNGPSLCVVSGSVSSVTELERRLTEGSVANRRLNVSHAFHSKFMEPLVAPLTELLKEIKLSPPAIPCVSNLTGSWITPDEATDPNFLARQLSQTVLFYDGVRELLRDPNRILLEAGPGNSLSSMAIQLLPRNSESNQGIFPLMRSSYDNQHDSAYLLRAAAQLWLSGAELDWSGLYAGERRRRVMLPTYPFERRRFWIEPRKTQPSERPTPEANGWPVAGSGAAAHEAATTVSERSNGESPLPLHTRANLRNPYVAPSNPTEARLAQIWQQLLGVERIGIHDNLFELGAHSLLAAQFVARLREVLPVEASLRTIYEAPTVGELAMVVEEMLIAKIEQLSDSEVESLMSEH